MNSEYEALESVNENFKNLVVEHDLFYDPAADGERFTFAGSEATSTRRSSVNN